MYVVAGIVRLARCVPYGSAVKGRRLYNSGVGGGMECAACHSVCYACTNTTLVTTVVYYSQLYYYYSQTLHYTVVTLQCTSTDYTTHWSTTMSLLYCVLVHSTGRLAIECT